MISEKLEVRLYGPTASGREIPEPRSLLCSLPLLIQTYYSSGLLYPMRTSFFTVSIKISILEYSTGKYNMTKRLT